jgi:ABC-type antimicrobial peptide transport system permease subunit
LGGEAALEVFYPYRQSAEANQYFLIRSSLPLPQVQQKVEEALWAIDPEQSVFDFKTYDQRVLDSAWQWRLSRTLLLLFGLVGLVLAAIGTYGVISYSAKQREREFGIRLALGAAPPTIQRLIIRRALRLGLVGIVLGTIGAVGLTRVLLARLPGLTSDGLQATAAASLVLLCVSVAAAALPAWKASRTDPATTLRVE